MKKFNLIFVLIIFVINLGLGQNSITFKPGSAIGKDAFVYSYPTCTSTNFGSNVQLGANNYNGHRSKCFISFESDLSSFFSSNTVIVTSATLKLYAYDNDPVGFGQHYNPGSPYDNSCTLYRVTGSWNESSITWNNHSAVAITTANAVTIPASISSQQNYSIDVTQIVNDMKQAGNYSGFRFDLNNVNTVNKRLNFASSDDADTYRHPELVINFINLSSMTKCFEESYSNVVIDDNWDNYDNTVFANNPQFMSNSAVTGGSNYFNSRSFIKFSDPLSEIPQVTGYDIVIDDAQLYLTAWNLPTGSSYHVVTGSGDQNTSYLQRVTAAWNTSTLTWNNQPGTTTTDQATLLPTTSQSDNRTGDVTDIIQHVFDHQTDHGLCLRLKTESNPFNRMNFRSIYYGVASDRPKLCIEYHYEASKSSRLASNQNRNYLDSNQEDYEFYPNPSNGVFYVKGDLDNIENIELYDVTGKKIGQGDFNSNQINLTSYENGIYIIKIATKNKSVITKKIIKQN